MSKIVGFKNEFGRVIAHSVMLEKHQKKFKLTPVYEGDPEALELREVIDITAEVVEVTDTEKPKKATRRTLNKK